MITLAEKSLLHTALNYPGLFPDLWSVLNQYFFTIGNGMEWLRGHLVDSYRPNRVYPFDLSDDVLQWNIFDPVKEYENWPSRAAFPAVINEVAEKSVQEDVCVAMRILENPEWWVRDRVIEPHYTIYPFSVEYCSLFTMPADAESSWVMCGYIAAVMGRAILRTSPHPYGKGYDKDPGQHRKRQKDLGNRIEGIELLRPECVPEWIGVRLRSTRERPVA